MVRKGKKTCSVNSAKDQNRDIPEKSEKADSAKDMSAKHSDNNNQADNKKNVLESCRGCGLLFVGSHKCSASGEVCLKCGKKGHFVRVCRCPASVITENNSANDDAIEQKVKSGRTRKFPTGKVNKDDEDHSEGREENNNENGRRKNSEIKVKIETKNPVDVLNDVKEKANALYRERKFKLALSQYTKLITLVPNSASNYCNRAACLMMLFKYKKALIDAKKSVELDPTLIKGYDRIFRIALALGNFSEAEFAISKLSGIDPANESLENFRKSISDVRLFIRNADEYFAKEEYAIALENIEKVVKVCNQCISYQIKKAEYLTRLEKYDDAVFVANAVLNHDKMNAEAKFILGVHFYQTDAVRAMNEFKEVLRLIPDHREALNLFKKSKAFAEKKVEADEALQRKKNKKAHEIYLEAIDIDPNNKGMRTKLYCNMAETSWKMRNFAESMEECTKALEIEPNCLQALKRRGQCHMNMEDYDEAVNDFAKAFKISNENECQRLLEDAKRLRTKGESDYHGILGLKRNFSPDELKKAYREKAMQYHPDRHSNASEAERKINEKKFKNVSRAYRNLVNRSSSDDDDYEDDFSGAFSNFKFWMEFQRHAFFMRSNYYDFFS